MAVTVSTSPSDSAIQVTARTKLDPPTIKGDVMTFNGSNIGLSAHATLLGKPGDSAVGWTAGFIQAEWVETNWCAYRGAANKDGSILIQKGRSPARTQRACRDCVDDVSDVFYYPKASSGEIAVGAADCDFPLVLRLTHFDKPSDNSPLQLRNTTTGKINFLHEAQLEFMFCALLSVRDPAGNFTHVMGIYWNTRWQYTFDQPGNRPIINPAGTGAVIGNPFHASMIDPRFAPVVTSTAQTKSCNDLANATISAYTVGSPNRHESRVWTDFDVTAP